LNQRDVVDEAVRGGCARRVEIGEGGRDA
jgi:hypothetical protein